MLAQKSEQAGQIQVCWTILKQTILRVKTPLKQLANITVTDAATISLNVWDKTAIQSIEKAIQTSDLGLSPVINGMNIHIKIPPLTQEEEMI